MQAQLSPSPPSGTSHKSFAALLNPSPASISSAFFELSCAVSYGVHNLAACMPVLCRMVLVSDLALLGAFSTATWQASVGSLALTAGHAGALSLHHALLTGSVCAACRLCLAGINSGPAASAELL